MAKLKKWQREVNWCKSNDIDRCCVTCKYAKKLLIFTIYEGDLPVKVYCRKHRLAKTKWNAVCDDWKKHKDN